MEESDFRGKVSVKVTLVTEHHTMWACRGLSDHTALEV